MTPREIDTQLMTMCNVPPIEAQRKDDIKFYVKLKGYKSTKYIPITTGQLREIEKILSTEM